MQKIRCTQCETEVRVTGLGAICPQCGALVTGGMSPATPVQPIEPADARVLDLLEVAPAQPPPEPVPIRHAPEFQMFQPQAKGPGQGVYWVIGILGFLVVVLMSLVVVLLNTRPQPAAVVTPPAPIPAPVAPASPRGSDWFVDPPADTAPAPVPVPTPAAERAPVVPAPVSPAPAVAPPSPPAPTTLPTPPPKPHEQLATLLPRAPVNDPRAVTDEQITTAIRRGSAYLLSQFAQTRLKSPESYDAQTFAGLNALATYALLQCGKNLADPRLAPQTELVRSLLERLKEYPMNGNRATYSRSLRISALTVFNRPEDRPAIQQDLQWLLRATMGGAYTYDMQPPERTRDQNLWDNSNSQYGALGVWAAAEAGLQVPRGYWQLVEDHWGASQLLSGGWAYRASHQPATLSMTAAGTNMLFVARDQLLAGGNPSTTFTPLSPQIQRALEWLDEGDNAIRFDTDHRGYVFYSLERAAMASGFRYFGKHDWYLTFAHELIRTQASDGSWTSNDGMVAETSFNLLFLLHGRDPVLYSKLRFDGAWDNRPREVSALTRYSSYQLERPHAWQVADVRRDWWDWADAPVLLITSDKAVNLPESAVDKLRAFAQNGGLIFLHTERESTEFMTAAKALSQRLFPDYPLEPLPQEHPVYSAVVPVDPKPPLQGISNGVRLLVLFCPTDLTPLWQPRPSRAQRSFSDMGVNIGVYATGRRDLRTRLNSPYVPEPVTEAIGTLPIARLRYQGNWDPEPAAWPRTSRILQDSTGMKLSIQSIDVSALSYESIPLAHLTGTQVVSFPQADVSALKDFVTRGGVLLIDSCGGGSAFADSIQSALLPQLAAGAQFTPLPQDHPIHLGLEPPATTLPRLQLRENLPAEGIAPRVARVGAGLIVFIPQDLSCGLLGVHTVGIRGYQPDFCQALVRNLAWWTTRHVAQVPLPAN